MNFLTALPQQFESRLWICAVPELSLWCSVHRQKGGGSAKDRACITERVVYIRNNVAFFSSLYMKAK